MADLQQETCLTRDELIAKYGKPERVADAAAVLALLGKPDSPALHPMAHRYPSVEAYEAFALTNRVRNRIRDHGIINLGPAVTGDGVFGVILLPDWRPTRG